MARVVAQHQLAPSLTPTTPAPGRRTNPRLFLPNSITSTESPPTTPSHHPPRPSPAPPEAPRLGWCCERGRSGRGRAGAPHGAAPTAAPSRLSQLGCWLLPLTPRVRRRGAATALRRAKQESWLTLIPCLLLGAVRILRSNDISRFMLGTFIAAAAGWPGFGRVGRELWAPSGGCYSNIRLARYSGNYS